MDTYSKLILFDVDHTLVKAAGHIEAFAIGIQKAYDVSASVYMINPHGMTDQQIVHDLLLMKGLDQVTIECGMAKCFEYMAEYYDDILPDIVAMKLMPGVRELLEKLANDGYLIGLVTGNIEPMAHAKMKKVGIDEYFKVGGYGSDSRLRSDLVNKAIQQATQNYGFKVNNNVYVVGDTPIDLKAAIESGTNPIMVATGTYSKEELLKAGSPVVLENLMDKEYFLSVITYGFI